MADETQGYFKDNEAHIEALRAAPDHSQAIHRLRELNALAGKQAGVIKTLQEELARVVKDANEKLAEQGKQIAALLTEKITWLELPEVKKRRADALKAQREAIQKELAKLEPPAEG